MNVTLFGAYHRPAAFGLDPAHHRHGRGVGASHAVAMSRLIKAVAGRHRPYFHWFEQDIALGIARHLFNLSVGPLDNRR